MLTTILRVRGKGLLYIRASGVRSLRESWTLVSARLLQDEFPASRAMQSNATRHTTMAASWIQTFALMGVSRMKSFYIYASSRSEGVWGVILIHKLVSSPALPQATRNLFLLPLRSLSIPVPPQGPQIPYVW